MKRLVTLLLLSAGLVVAWPAAVSADTATTMNVTGFVLYVDDTDPHHVARGADVEVTCGDQTKTDISDEIGAYEVTFATVKCPLGSLITVTAQKDDNSGLQSGSASDAESAIDVHIAPAAAVPEMGAVAGIGAGVVSAGALLALRRRSMTSTR